MSRRVVVRAAAPVAALALVLAACGSGPTGGDQGLKGADQQVQGKDDINPVEASKLKDGGEFKWPVDSLPDNWNYNQLDGTNANGQRMIFAVEPNIFVQKPDSTIELNKDYLEDATVTSQDPQVITYKISPKAKWSDGAAFSWEDFAAQAKANNGSDAAFQTSSTTGYEDIDKVEKGANDQEVKVTFKKKFAEWRSLFGPLYPKSLNASADEFNKGWADAPKITAGPFKVGTIDLTGKIVTLVRDPAWWGEKPKLEKITFRVVDRTALADALANGAIDFYDIGSNVDLFKRAQQTPGVKVRQAVTPDYNHLTFNGASTAVMSDPKLRTTVMQGIDTATIAKAILGPIQPDPKVLGNHIYLLGAKEYKDNSAVAKYDKEAAKKSLDDLGWKLEGDVRKKDGKDLAIRFLIPTPNPTSDQVSKLVQAQLKEVGVKVDIQTVPVADFFKSHVNVGDFDITSFRWLSTAFPISSSKSIYALDPANVNQNYGRIGSDEINKLFDEANAELDDTKRAELANKIDEAIWKSGHQLPIFQSPGAVAVRDTVANFGAVGFANNPYDYVHIGFTS